MAYSIEGTIYDAIVKAGSTYGIEKELIAGIIRVESNFTPPAYNASSCCAGLMQIHPAYHSNSPVWCNNEWVGGAGGLDWSRIYEVEYNVMAGAAILNAFLTEPYWGCYGDVRCALTRYGGFGDDTVGSAWYVGDIFYYRDLYKVEGLVRNPPLVIPPIPPAYTRRPGFIMPPLILGLVGMGLVIVGNNKGR